MNANWVANGLSQDLPPLVVMQGVRNGVELAIWRSAAGKLSAWKDRCPHRGMRLSHGFVRGETLACIYHGWVYGTNGACHHIPAHPAMVPPATIRTEAFLCREQDGIIWVGTGQPGDGPPVVDGCKAVRSMTVAAGAAALAQALPQLSALCPSMLRGTIDAGTHRAEVCLLLQEKPAQQTAVQQTAVHALCGADDDRVAVSRWLDGMRRRVENGVPA